MSLLPVTDPRVFRLRGGNGQLSPAVLRAANATVHLSAAVTAVRRQQDGRYMLEVGAQAQGPFDTVVLATPLEGSGGLRVEGVALPPIPARKYQQVGRGGQGGREVGWRHAAAGWRWGCAREPLSLPPPCRRP